jgi:hypothetical protein
MVICQSENEADISWIVLALSSMALFRVCRPKYTSDDTTAIAPSNSATAVIISKLIIYFPFYLLPKTLSKNGSSKMQMTILMELRLTFSTLSLPEDIGSV